MPTIILKVDCGYTDQPLDKDEIALVENKVQEALTEIDFKYLVFDTKYKSESLLDLEDEEIPDTRFLAPVAEFGARKAK